MCWSKQVKEARKKAGISQTSMSGLLDIPLRTIQNWEGLKNEPALWAQRLVLKELEEIAKEKDK